MRANPILTLGMMAGALALPGAASALGLGRLTVQSSIGQPLSRKSRSASATREELDSLTRADRRSESLSAEQPCVQRRAGARPDHARARRGGEAYLRSSRRVR